MSPEELWQMGLTIRDAPAALPGVLEAFRTKGAGEPTDFGLTEADKQVGLIWRKLHPTICEVMPLVGKKLISTGLAVQMWGAEFAKADETHRKNIEALAAADAAKHQPR